MDSKLEIISFIDRVDIDANLVTVTKASDLLEGGKYFDIAIYDEASHIDFEDFKDICENKIIFTIAIIEEKDNAQKYKDSAKAWILKDAFNSDNLNKLLSKVKNELNMKKELYYSRKGLQKLLINNSVHISNIDMIKKLISESTSSIAKNFECRVNEIRELDSDVGSIMLKLSDSINKVDGDKKGIEESLKSAEELHENMKTIIRSLFSYISILQCEDRLFQMLDGIANIMKDTQYLEDEEFLAINRETKDDLLRELVEFYTIQEQRDFVLGIEESEEDSSQSSELTLF
jgi:hypothetical protein